MNIFWIVTDSICNYERSDLHGLLPIYKTLKNSNEGFYFENALAQFPSTVLSIFSFLTGRFPYYIFSDFDKLTKTLPSLKDRNFITQLKYNGYNIESILFWREGVDFLKEILNPYDDREIFKGDHWLDAKEIYDIFLKQIKRLKIDEDNFYFIFFRPSDPQTDFCLTEIIKYLEDNSLWKESIFILNSDHGFYDKNLYKRIKLLHFDDIHQSSLRSAMFMKIPLSLTNTSPRIIEKRVYLFDIMETVLDYLGFQIDYERESLSFKDLIEKKIDINITRKVRSDCYLIFQSIEKAAIFQNDWKLYINNGKYSLFDLSKDPLEKKDVSKVNPRIYKDLYNFYLTTEVQASDIFISGLNDFFDDSVLKGLKSEYIYLPDQFPPQIVKFLKEQLKINNKIISPMELKNNALFKKQKNLVTILIFNRMTGYGIKRLRRKLRKYTKRFIFIDTSLSDASGRANQAGYVKFIINSIIKRRSQLFQRWKEILVWILYFPFYFNMQIRKYYN
ncbi:MAG: hypothetical protein ACFFA3_10590 [Promethearchaeota archaeon]